METKENLTRNLDGLLKDLPGDGQKRDFRRENCTLPEQNYYFSAEEIPDVFDILDETTIPE